ncbi:metalloprotease [Candidatus Photodesmus blepharus]|uniref:Metalloprotease n=1 Tax=Candidatus Photodesmus blepharonis TaxID=1179155 RepID=A0A084CMN3_9GAMM|nr:metalloprotease [Candidatus Photodesmus blepharus]
MIIISFLPNPKELSQGKKNYEIGPLYPIKINTEALSSSNASIQSSKILRWNKHTIGSGENTAVLFQRHSLSSRLLHELININSDIKSQLTKLRPGDIMEFGFDENNNLVKIRRILNALETFVVYKTNSGFRSKFNKKALHFQYNYKEAKITSNFWNAGINAGLTGNQIIDLAGIFSWDIDFALDIRKGDQFKILYQEQIVEGEIIGRGHIIAAIFVNQGDTFTAILDNESGQYYNLDGDAMKKAFLRSPIDFRCVTSNFNPHRLHPITGKVEPHRGTDYSAPIGTPIWAAGDGVVQKSSYNNLNGHYVFIRHNYDYITKYLHMERRMVKTGQRVKQGQIIGTLGGTGRVTGPHLHYEFLFKGIHQNARTVKLPQSQSLKDKAKIAFIANAKILLKKLEHYSKLLY